MGVAGYLTAATPPRLAVGGIVVAIPVLAVEQLGDVALGGLLAAAALGPSIVAAPIVGAVLDRTRRPGAFVAGAGLVAAAAFTVAAFLGVVPTGVVALALVVAGIAVPFVMGGLSSFVTEVIPDERRAYAIDALAYNLGAVAGPAAVAAAAAFGSARLATLLMAGSALLGAVGTIPLRLRPVAGEPHTSMLHTIAAGFRHIATHRPLAVIISSGTLSQFGAGGLAIAAVALSVQRGGDAGGGALIVTAFAIGGLLGAIGTIPLRLRPVAGEPHASMLRTIAAGFRHIATHRPLAVITTSGTLSQFGAGGLAIAAVALSVQRGGDAGGGALIVTAFAIGGLVGALWNSANPPRFRPEITMGVGFAATGVFTVPAALDVGTTWTIAAIGVSGLFTAASSAAMLLIRKQQSPPSLRSQVFTVGAGLRAAAAAAGAAVAGLAAGLGAEALIVAIGLVWIASGAMLVLYPRHAPAIDGSVA